jgi:phosphoribosylanthranilate isomerase
MKPLPQALVKVCGITNQRDAQAAVDAGAHALGFNFYSKSPRYLEADERHWIAGFNGSFIKVGVFVDQHPDVVRDIAESLKLDVVQIHLGIGPEEFRTWPALSIDDAASIEENQAEAVLVDAPPLPGLPGGTGKTYDWSRAQGLPGRIILAGGLDETNVAEAIRTARPWGVDACSRLESRPGLKDHDKMAAFIRAANKELCA